MDENIIGSARKLFVIYIIISIAILLLCAAHGLRREKQFRQMDKREAAYDADGPIVLIDTDNHLIGVYDVCSPLAYIYSDDTNDIKEGIYNLISYGNQIELRNKQNEEVANVILYPFAVEYIEDTIGDNIPAIVY